MKKTMKSMMMSTAASLLALSLWGATGSSDWFYVDTTDGKPDFIVRLHGNGGLPKGGNEPDEIGFRFDETKNLMPCPFERGGNEFLGWQIEGIDYAPDHSGFFDCESATYFRLTKGNIEYLTQNRVVTIENETPVLNLYAIWTTSVRYDFYNKADDLSLTPSSLADKIWWRRSDEDSSVKHMSGELVETPPGVWTVHFDMEDGIDWLVAVPPDEKLSISHDVSIETLPPIGTSRRQIYYCRDVSAKNPFGATVMFVCHPEDSQSLKNATTTKFDASRVSISIEYWIGGSRYGQSLGNFKPGKVYTLPKGTCVAKFTYDNRNAPNNEGWAPVDYSPSYVFDGSSPSLRRIDVNFMWLGTGVSDRGAHLVYLDANGGTCGVSKMFYPYDIGGLGDDTHSTFIVNTLPPAYKDENHKFTGWKTQGGEPIQEGQRLDASIEVFVAQYEALTLGAVFRDIVDGVLTSVLPNGYKAVSLTSDVKTISADAFVGCEGLETITFEGDAPAVEEGAFTGLENCTILVSKDSTGWGVAIPGVWNGMPIDYFTPLGTPTFTIVDGVLTAVELNGATNVVIPDGVTEIGNNVFKSCKDLVSVTMPDSVRTIGKDSFCYCISLTSVRVGDRVSFIGAAAFMGCRNLVNFAIPKNVVSIGDAAFENCRSLTNVTISARLTRIRNYVFNKCSGLTSVTLADNVKSIGKEAFCDCSGLVSITIPTGVTTIAESAFSGCSGLSSIIISDNVRSIEKETFRDCSGLTSITIPSGVTNIAESAFTGCSGLSSIIISDNVKSIGKEAFCDCSGLASITIPTGVTVIESGTFKGCTGLTRIRIPDSVTRIEYSAFTGCNSLYDVATIPGVLLVDGWAVGYDDSLSGALDLSGIRGIVGSAFKDCTGVTSVTIPEAVTSIEDSIFSGCRGLTSVTMPDSVTSIGYEAFALCSGLTSIKIPNSVTNLASYLFFNGTNDEWGTSLTSIVFAGNAPNVSHSTFVGVSDECTAYVRRDSTGWNVEIPGTWYGINIAYDDQIGWNTGGNEDENFALNTSPQYGGVPSAYKGGTFNGYVKDADGNVAGTFSLAVKKPAKGKDTAAATLTFVSLANGKKTKISGSVNLATGEGSGGLAGLTFGADAVGGTVAKVGALEGGADAAKAKDAAALSALAKFSGKSYVAVLGTENPSAYAQGGYSTLSIAMAAKGKAKVSGVLADGTKVTAPAQMTVGDTYCCVPVVYAKKSKFGFVAWFDRNTRELVGVTALTPWRNTVKPAFTMDWNVVYLGAKGAVAAGTRTVALDGVKLSVLVPGAIEQTPVEIPLTVKGVKWDAGKAAKVAYKGGVTVAGANVSGLKLTYTAKTGLFKGGFTVYAVKGGKLVKNKFTVNGAVTGGIGYGSAVLKGRGSAAVTVE